MNYIMNLYCYENILLNRIEQVLRYCFFLWLSLGNSKFEKLRDVMILPSKRTLQLFKSKIPKGDGYRQEVFDELGT